jgi:hypothetical protein
LDRKTELYSHKKIEFDPILPKKEINSYGFLGILKLFGKSFVFHISDA